MNAREIIRLFNEGEQINRSEADLLFPDAMRRWPYEYYVPTTKAYVAHDNMLIVKVYGPHYANYHWWDGKEWHEADLEYKPYAQLD